MAAVVQVRGENSSSQPFEYRNDALATFALEQAAPTIVAPQTVPTRVTVTVIWAIG